MSWRTEQLSDSVTLHCGDCREILPTLGKVDAIVSDPPYGMAFRSNHRGEKHDAIANDGDATLLAWACGLPTDHSRYLFARWDNLVGVPKPTSCVTWVKNNWSMGDLAHEHGRQTEVVLFYPGPNHRWPKGRPNDVIFAPRTGNAHHPTEKPVQLMLAVVEWTLGGGARPLHGLRDGGRGLRAPGPALRRYRDRVEILRHRLPADLQRAEAGPAFRRGPGRAGASAADAATRAGR